MNRDYDHIREYIEADVDEDTRLLVSDFALLWNNYEHYLFSRKGEPNYSFYQLIKEDGVFNNRIAKNIDHHLEDINKFYQEIMNYLKNKIAKNEITADDVINYFNIRIVEDGAPRGEFKTRDEFRKIYNEKSTSSKYIVLLLITGRVRNNMFHGIKLIKELNNQKELFKICNSVLTLTLNITNTLVFV